MPSLWKPAWDNTRLRGTEGGMPTGAHVVPVPDRIACSYGGTVFLCDSPVIGLIRTVRTIADGRWFGAAGIYCRYYSAFGSVASLA